MDKKSNRVVVVLVVTVVNIVVVIVIVVVLVVMVLSRSPNRTSVVPSSLLEQKSQTH